MTPHRWFVFDSGPKDFAFNMGLDEALLEAMPRLGSPVLRFYGWTANAASFGYFQKYAEVEQLTLLRPLVRRPTGGGVVPHDADWTYCLAFPPAHAWYALRAVDSYRRVHEWIRSAFDQLHVTVSLASDCRKAAPGQCFVGHERFDLLWQGRKVAGAAQRRTKDGLLIQGSVQPPPGPSRQQWQQAMRVIGEKEYGARWVEFPDHESVLNRAAELARDKYSQSTFQRK